MLTVTVAAVLITALIAAYGWHRTRRALIAERAARALTEGALHRDATQAVTAAQDAVAEAQRVLRAGLLPALALREAETVIDYAYTTSTTTHEGDPDV